MHESQIDPLTSVADLLTRRCLIGSGIVSGLEIALDEFHRICITPGKGITSDGTYVENTSNRIFSFYREFIPNSEYPLFGKHEDGLFPIWEIISDDQFLDSDQPLNPQSNREKLNPFLKNKVVLLFLDKTLQNPDDEIKISSKENSDVLENHEDASIYSDLHKQHNIKFLIMRLEDVLHHLDISKLTSQIVWERLEDDQDYIYSDDYNPEDNKPLPRDVNLALNPALRLSEIPLLRFGFGKGDPYDCPPGEVDQSEFPTLFSLDDIYNGYLIAIDETIDDLDYALRKLYRYYQPLLGKYPQWNIPDTLDILCDKWEAFKKNNQENDISLHRKEYIQYFYDWVRDLLKSYHELRRLLIDFSFLSLSEGNSFPCHLLLGEPLREEVSKIPRPFRQHFKQPIIYNGQQDRLPKIRLYFWRTLVMIKSFYLPEYIAEEHQKKCNNELPPSDDEKNYNKVKITPGKSYAQPLANQSIPYYYSPVARYRYSLHHFWNYSRTKNSTTDKITCFHANDGEDSYTDQIDIIRPLHYNLDSYSFYRIEGHIGRKLLDFKAKGVLQNGVLEELHYLKRKYNLDFGILALPISQLRPLSKTYPERNTPPPTFESFFAMHLGMEHLGGVEKGGTFAIVYDEENQVIADFSLPYKCCHYCFSGMIVDCLSQEPISSITIQIQALSQPNDTINIQSDESGQFAICLKTGHYRVVIEQDNYQRFAWDLHLDGDIIKPIELVIPKGRISGELVVEPALTESERANTTIHLFKDKVEIGSVALDADNHFEVDVSPDQNLILVLRIRGNDVQGSSTIASVAQCQITTLLWEVKREQVIDLPTPDFPGELDFETRRNAILDVVGKVADDKRNDLKIIKGIGPKAEKVLNNYGIVSFKQLGKMNSATFEFMSTDLNTKGKLTWAKEAAKLAKNK